MGQLANSNHLVMVDDNPAEVELARTCFDLSDVPNPWLSFASGPSFLRYLEGVKRGSSPMPALVLLDINMPEMNGFDVLRGARDDPFFATLPIFLMLTNSEDVRDREQATQLGATGFQIKPPDVSGYIAFFNSLR